MITSFKELHTTIKPADGASYYNYFVCKVRSGKRGRYDVYRLGDRWEPKHQDWKVTEVFEIIGRELPLGTCHQVIQRYEPYGTTVVQHKASPRKAQRRTRVDPRIRDVKVPNILF